MRKVSPRDIRELYAVILSLRNTREANSFFKDLLTEGEIEEFAERWKVASMIARKVPYTSIIEETGLSSRTVARVARWVHKGTGGLRLLLKRRGVLRP